MSKNEQKRAEGAAEEIGGKIKQGIGKVIGNEQMQAEGIVKEKQGEAKQESAKAAERTKGKIEEAVGAVKNRVGAVIDNEQMEAEGKAKELEGGHLHHAEVHTNPANGEVEDTDVGFPGAEHHIAEHNIPMKVAMGCLAVLAIIGGIVQIPEVTHTLDSFLEPTFEDSVIPQASDNNGLMVFGLALGTVLGLVGIGIAYRLWVQNPEAPARIQARDIGRTPVRTLGPPRMVRIGVRVAPSPSLPRVAGESAPAQP